MATLRRYNRELSPTKPSAMKLETWSKIQHAHARRKAWLSGPGHAKKSKALARTLWKTKAAHQPSVMIVGKAPAPKAAPTHTASHKRIRFGAPLRHIPKAFKKKSMAI